MRSYTPPRKFDLHAAALRFLISIALVLTLVLCCGFATAGAAEPSFGGGSGTEADPYLISSAEDLVALANAVNTGEAEQIDALGAGVGNYYGFYFKQTKDIDLAGIAWEPIGYSGGIGRYFAGNYDGDNHSVKNMVSNGKVDSDGYSSVGVFGWLYGNVVSNLHVENADFTATGQNAYSYAGGICGVCYGATVRNCSVENSTIRSLRVPFNNNAAGGIAGYSTGGTFEKCASVGNTIVGQVYSGGFVGEVDDTYGAGYSTFTNCYTAKCDVSAYSSNRRDSNLAAGFMGTVTDDGGIEGVELTNCYVFDTEIHIDETSASNNKMLAVFGNFMWPTYDSMITTNCYYGECDDVTDRVGTAVEKEAGMFKDGTVVALLGDAFVQGKEYPIFKAPADYSKVDAAIGMAQTLNPDAYKNFASVTAAINAVVRGKDNAEQDLVDGMAKAIEDAIKALVPIAQPGDMPETGDHSLIILWMMLLALSVAGMLAIMRKKA